MRYAEKKKERKEELKSEKSSRAPMSPFKKKLARGAVELGIFLAGVLVIMLCRVAFTSFVIDSAESAGIIAVTTDNFILYFKISLILCAVLLVLTMLSALTYLFQKEISRFQRMTVSASPVICSAAVFAVACFYAYLTAGGAVSIAGYLVILGLGEAMLFRLPCAVYVLLRKGDAENKNVKVKGKK